MAAALHIATSLSTCSGIVTRKRSALSLTSPYITLPHSISNVAFSSLKSLGGCHSPRKIALSYGESSCSSTARIRASTAVESGTDSVTTVMHALPSGLRMEVLVLKASGSSEGKNKKPPLVFIHGSYHAAWCWAEHWMPFFASRGFDCYATSILGQVTFQSSPCSFWHKLRGNSVALHTTNERMDEVNVGKKNLVEHVDLAGTVLRGLCLRYPTSSPDAAKELTCV